MKHKKKGLKKAKKQVKEKETIELQKKIREDEVKKSIAEKSKKVSDFETVIFNIYKKETGKEAAAIETSYDGNKTIIKSELTGEFLNWYNLNERKLKNKFDLTKIVELNRRINSIGEDLAGKFGYELIYCALMDDARGDIVRGYLDTQYLNSAELIGQNVLGIALYLSKKEYRATSTRSISKAELDKLHKHLVIFKTKTNWKFLPDIKFKMVILYTPFEFNKSIIFIDQYKSTKEGIPVKMTRGNLFIDILTQANWDVPMVLWTGSPGIGTYINKMKINEKKVLLEIIKNQKELLAGFSEVAEILKDKGRDYEKGKENWMKSFIEYKRKAEAFKRQLIMKDVKDFSKLPEVKDSDSVIIDAKTSVKTILYIISLIGGIVIILVILGAVFGNTPAPAV